MYGLATSNGMNGTDIGIPSDNNRNFIAIFSLRNIIFYGASIALISIVYLRWGDVHDLREIFYKSNISGFIVAIFLQIITYVFMSLNYHYIFRIKGHKVSFWELFPMVFIVKFLNRVFPTAGLSGQIFLIDYLRMRGATIADGIGRSILEIVSMFCGFGAMFIIASVLYFGSGAFMQNPNIIYLIYVFWFFAALALAIFFIVQRPKNRNLISTIVNYFRNKYDRNSDNQDRGTGKIKSYWSLFVVELRNNLNSGALKANAKFFNLAILWQCVVLFIDVLTLYVLTFALNINISFALVFVIFIFTQFVSMISFVPGSLLVFEGGMSIMLIGFGVDYGSALTLALLFRTLTFWLPMPIGWLLYREHEKNYQKFKLTI